MGASAGAASATINTPAVAAALGMSSSTAALVAGPVIGGIAILLMAWLNRKGPQQKVATTQIVNEAEPILAENRDRFLSGPRTPADKEFAVAVFNKVWGEVVALCSDTRYGNPGKNCVSDRQRGGRWDWAKYYLDPILETPTQEQSAGEGLGLGIGIELPSVASLGGSNLGLALGLGLVVLGLAMSDSTQRGR